MLPLVVIKNWIKQKGLEPRFEDCHWGKFENCRTSGVSGGRRRTVPSVVFVFAS